MKAEQFVKQHYPRASIEKQVAGQIKGLQRTYYLVRKTWRETMYIGNGPTKTKAWENAKQTILKSKSPE